MYRAIRTPDSREKNHLLRRGLLIIGFFSAGPLALSRGPLLPADPGEGPWKASFAEALEESAKDGKPILLYIPSARSGDAPPGFQEPGPARRILEGFHTARARAGDVGMLLGTFRVEKLPALLFVDRWGGGVDRWEGDLPADLWMRIGRTAQKLRASEEEASRALAGAKAALGREDFPSALSFLARVRAAARPRSPEAAEALRREAEILRRADEELRKVLALEGILPDRDILRDLSILRSRFPREGFLEVVDAETERLRARPLAGGRKDDRDSPRGGTAGRGKKEIRRAEGDPRSEKGPKGAPPTSGEAEKKAVESPRGDGG